MAKVTVTVEQGKLEGKTDIDFAGNVYYSFHGIPFAKSPVGKLRFKDPQPAEPWEGVRDATKEGSACCQMDILQNKIIGSEDCLFLNVYTPKVEKKETSTLKPVMFWIHGGGFYCGSSNTDVHGPDYLITEDVVLVTTNYRVGLLGFLKLDDPSLEVPGNAGLKDIILALHWVKFNIHNFNGDPNNITIFGLSAGSAAVQYLLLSPLSKGLFHKAIMQSGSAFNPWARGHQRNEQYAQLLDLKTANEKDILDSLQELSSEQLLLFQEKLNDYILDGSKRPYGPTIEKASVNAFLPEDPKIITRAGTYIKVPLIIGHCNAEGMLGLFMGARKGQKPIHTDFENFVPHAFGIERGSNESKQIAQKIKNFYYNENEPSLETLTNYIELESDVFFVHAIQKTIENAIQKSQQPVFFYRFCFEGSRNFLKSLMQCPAKGTCHGDDLGYLFKPHPPPGLQLPPQFQPKEEKPGSPEEMVTKYFIRLWANFAKFGNPNHKGKDEVINVEWEPVGGNGLNCLNIDRELSVGVNPEAARMQFWDELYNDYPSAKFW